MNWTPERIAAVRERLDRYVSWHSDDADPEARRIAQSADDVATLARIGLAVVEARPETVERVFSVLAWGSPERPPELADDDQMARAMAGNPALVAQVRAVLAALSGE